MALTHAEIESQVLVLQNFIASREKFLAENSDDLSKTERAVSLSRISVAEKKIKSLRSLIIRTGDGEVMVKGMSVWTYTLPVWDVNANKATKLTVYEKRVKNFVESPDAEAVVNFDNGWALASRCFMSIELAKLSAVEVLTERLAEAELLASRSAELLLACEELPKEVKAS